MIINIHIHTMVILMRKTDIKILNKEECKYE